MADRAQSTAREFRTVRHVQNDRAAADAAVRDRAIHNHNRAHGVDNGL